MRTFLVCTALFALIYSASLLEDDQFPANVDDINDNSYIWNPIEEVTDTDEEFTSTETSILTSSTGQDHTTANTEKEKNISTPKSSTYAAAESATVNSATITENGNRNVDIKKLLSFWRKILKDWRIENGKQLKDWREAWEREIRERGECSQEWWNKWIENWRKEIAQRVTSWKKEWEKEQRNENVKLLPKWREDSEITWRAEIVKLLVNWREGWKKLKTKESIERTQKWWQEREIEWNKINKQSLLKWRENWINQLGKERKYPILLWSQNSGNVWQKLNENGLSRWNNYWYEGLEREKENTQSLWNAGLFRKLYGKGF